VNRFEVFEKGVAILDRKGSASLRLCVTVEGQSRAVARVALGVGNWALGVELLQIDGGDLGLSARLERLEHQHEARAALLVEAREALTESRPLDGL
jgi:hypothetical protein